MFVLCGLCLVIITIYMPYSMHRSGVQVVIEFSCALILMQYLLLLLLLLLLLGPHHMQPSA